MAIFAQAKTTPAQNAAKQLITNAQRVYEELTKRLAHGQKLLWSCPNAQVDDIIAAMGTNATHVFNAGVALQAFLNTFEPGTNTFVAPRGYTINSDGTITLAPAAAPVAAPRIQIVQPAAISPPADPANATAAATAAATQATDGTAASTAAAK